MLSLRSSGPQPIPRSLPPVAEFVDEELARIDHRIDWLTYLSPLDSDELWERFVASGFRDEPTLRYAPFQVEPSELRRALTSLPLADVEHPVLKSLFAEKQAECELFTWLVESRGTRGTLAASLQLFGGTEAHLLHTAKTILQEVPSDHPTGEVMADCSDFVRAAEHAFAKLRSSYPQFSSQLVIEDDLNSHLLVQRGHLHVARSIVVPQARILPLLAHEIGTHCVTHHNGASQALRLLEIGLPGYDETQEGLGAFSEYLAGYLPPVRLRVLAARVVAAEMAVHGSSITDMFSCLFEEHQLPEEHAFDVAVRAGRGGGLTKDAVYLRGLFGILEHIKQGGTLVDLFMGKFALDQLPLLEELQTSGWLIPAQVLPDFLLTEGAKRRLEAARTLPIERLFQAQPETP